MIDWYEVALDLYAARASGEEEWEDSPFVLACWWRVALRNLGASLAWAGAMCAAFHAGEMWQWNVYWRTNEGETPEDVVDGLWRPGCGRPMPGWEDR